MLGSGRLRGLKNRSEFSVSCIRYRECLVSIQGWGARLGPRSVLVIFSPILNNFIFGTFDPTNDFFDNRNK